MKSSPDALQTETSATRTDRPNRLGRGLAALLGESPEPVTSGHIQQLPIARLEPNPSQPRGAISEATLDELAKSVRQQGILQPLLVRRHAHDAQLYQIIAGERRWRAAGIAGLETVPCLVVAFDDQQSAAAALVENLQRLDLNAIEEADGYERLISQYRITQEALAEIVGKSRSHVANTLRLRRLPPSVQEHVRTGALSAGHARALLSHADPVRAADRIIEKGLSVRDAEAMLVDPIRPPAQEKPVSPPDPDLAAVEQEIAEKLGVPARIRAQSGRGTLTLRFTNLDQLDLLIARLCQ